MKMVRELAFVVNGRSGGRDEDVWQKGELPSPMNPPSGCAFHPRCPHAMPRCREEAPVLVDRGEAHQAACHLYD